MINLGLTATETKRLNELLVGPHHVEITVALLDLNHTYLKDLSPMLFDGQVNMNARAEVSRSAGLTLWDPEFEVGIDSASPDKGAMFYTRMIRIIYSVWGHGDTRRFNIPLFCGPITSTERTGGFLTLACMGKEILSKGVVWSPFTVPKGMRQDTVFRRLMTNRGGETKFDITPATNKTGGFTLAKEEVIWEAAGRVVRAMGQYMFYDGRGVLRTRKMPGSVSWEFRDGDGGSILSEPKPVYDDDEIRNVVWVVGGIPKGSKTRVSAQAYLEYAHALNWYKIGRRLTDGTAIPRVLLEKIEDNQLMTGAASKAIANQSLTAYADQQGGLTMDVVTIPLLEESDLVRVTLQGVFSANYRVIEMAFPLIGPVASFGSSKNLKFAGRNNSKVIGASDAKRARARAKLEAKERAKKRKKRKK